MNGLVEELASALDRAGEWLWKEDPDLGRPVRAWDGEARVWIWRGVVDAQYFCEVVARLFTEDLALAGREDDATRVSVAVEARAWNPAAPEASWASLLAKTSVSEDSLALDAVDEWLAEWLVEALHQATSAAESLPDIVRRRKAASGKVRTVSDSGSFRSH